MRKPHEACTMLAQRAPAGRLVVYTASSRNQKTAGAAGSAVRVLFNLQLIDSGYKERKTYLGRGGARRREVRDDYDLVPLWA